MAIVTMTKLSAALAIALPTAAMSREPQLRFDIPQPTTAEWHRPFIAIWIEDASGKTVRQVAVFHDRTRIGARWLPELRQWWRSGGRAAKMPADGISRATPAVGVQTVPLGMVSTLPDGQYALIIEGTREKGSHELVRLPIRVAGGTPSSANARGRTELGAASIRLHR